MAQSVGGAQPGGVRDVAGNWLNLPVPGMTKTGKHEAREGGEEEEDFWEDVSPEVGERIRSDQSRFRSRSNFAE